MPLPDTSGAPSRRTHSPAPVPTRADLMAGADEWVARQQRSDDERLEYLASHAVDVSHLLVLLLDQDLHWAVERPF
jgi:hypothetical protein